MEDKIPYQRRKNPLVERRAQLYLSLVIVSYLVAYTVILLFIILFPSAVTLGDGAGTLQGRFDAGREFIFLDQRVVPYLIIVMAALAVHFLFLTHRIFGPLVRLRRTFLEWPDGRWPRMFIKRRKDFHGDLFTAFNASVAKVEEDMKGSRELMGAALEEIRRAGEEGSGTEPAGALRRAEEKCRAAVASMDRYFPPGDPPGGDAAAAAERADEK